MSRTYRAPERGWNRTPKGKKNALVNEVRKGAIPPDDWDNIRPSTESNWFKVAVRMLKSGMSFEEVRKKVQRRFKVPSWVWESNLDSMQTWIDYAENQRPRARRKFPLLDIRYCPYCTRDTEREYKEVFHTVKVPHYDGTLTEYKQEFRVTFCKECGGQLDKRRVRND